jgi:hypothetical protein
MAIVTNLKSKRSGQSEQTFSIEGVELKIGSEYVDASKNGMALVYNHLDKAMELKHITPPSITGSSGTEVIVVDTLGVLPEGSTYDDGLLPLTPDTKINDAIDKINEMLRAMSPKSAALINHITHPSVSGLSNLKLSFGSDVNDFSTYASPSDSIIIRNSAYPRIKRVGTSFNLVFEVNGGEPVDAKFPAKVFKDVSSGNLVAYVNGAKLMDRPLSSIQSSGTTITDNGVTMAIGAINYVKLEDGSNLMSAPYRTATVTFNAPHLLSNGFKRGWNTVRVGRELEGKNVYSNTIDFILIDNNDAPALAINSATISDPTLEGLIHLSGVKYNTKATYKFTASVDNMYALVYQSDETAITHNTTTLFVAGVSIKGDTLTTSNSTSLPQLGSESNAATQSIIVETTLTKTTNTYPSDILAYSVTAKHPLKGSFNSQSVTKNGLLIYTAFGSSTLENEDFRSENFRLQNDDYTILPYASIDSNNWDSSIALNNNNEIGHYNGLSLWKNQLVHPKVVGNLVSFGPEGNIDYSTMSGVCTYYRKFKINSEASMPYVILDIVGVGQFSTQQLNFSVGSPTNETINPSGQAIAVSMMIVKENGEKTGFFNPFVYHSAFGYNGRRFNGTSIVGGGGAITSSNIGLVIEFLQGYTINKNDVIILKIQANDTWTGNVNTLRFKYN